MCAYRRGITWSIPLLEKDGFSPDIESVISQITGKSRMIVINSPNNPTGSVLSYEDLSRIARVIEERDLLVISDEVYEKITYDDTRHYCLAGERTVAVGSFSKTYAMTGFRVGYAYGPEQLIAPMMLALQFSVACVDGPAQYAALGALNGPQDFVASMVAEFDRRRKLMYSRLNEIEGFECCLPKGAFYVFPDVRRFGASSEEIASRLVKETGW